MRPRKSNNHLPKSVYHRHGAYFLVRDKRWLRLGTDLETSILEYRRLTTDKSPIAKPLEDAFVAITHGLAPNTITQYRQATDKLKSYLQQFRPEQVMMKHIAKIKHDMRNTPNMANRVLTVARLLFNHLLEAQLVDNNPAVGIGRLPEGKRTRLVSAEEFKAMKAFAAPRLAIMLDIWFLTGQRVMDVVKIRRADLLDEGIRFEQDKTGAKLIVAWTDDLTAAVQAAKALNGNVLSPYLFQANKGKHRGQPPCYTAVRDQFQRCRKAAGIEDIQMRDLRAMSGTQAEKQGMDPTALLGHTSRKMTERYLRDRVTPVVQGPKLDPVVLDIGQRGKKK